MNEEKLQAYFLIVVKNKTIFIVKSRYKLYSREKTNIIMLFECGSECLSHLTPTSTLNMSFQLKFSYNKFNLTILNVLVKELKNRNLIKIQSHLKQMKELSRISQFYCVNFVPPMGTFLHYPSLEIYQKKDPFQSA